MKSVQSAEKFRELYAFIFIDLAEWQRDFRHGNDRELFQDGISFKETDGETFGRILCTHQRLLYSFAILEEENAGLETE